MRRDEELPIEPLSDAAWQRIERNVYAELDADAGDRASAGAEPRWPRWAVVAMACVVGLQLALGAAFLWMRGEGSKSQALASTRLTTGKEPSKTLLGDVWVQLEPESALVVVENGARSSLLMLERGAARFSVPHRGERAPFVVQAGDARVEVVGTRFRVERAGGTARVDTYEGTVRVTAQGRTLLVARGQHWAGEDAPAPEATPQQVAVQPAPPASARAPDIAEPTTNAIERNAQDAPARAERQRRRFEQAAAHEASDPERALRIYRGLAAEQGAWAANALYAMGRLEMDRGHAQTARRLLQRYIDEYPNGANAADARALVARNAQ
jgi:hypothetical protein